MTNHLLRSALAAVGMGCGLSHGAFLGLDGFTGSFEAIQDPVCYSPSFYNAFTVGGQYLDPNNGVIDGTHSMLARWQGDSFVSNVVSYDMGRWDGLHVSNQRGYEPEDATNGSPGVAVNCNDFGMLIDTKFNPHRPIVGGGYNDMYGYSWAAGSGPRPFTKNNLPTHLVLQANVGLANFKPTAVGGAISSDAGSANIGFFAYLRDTTQNLPPIVVLAMTHEDLAVGGLASGGMAGYDYSENNTTAAAGDYPAWLSGATGGGIWYTAGPIVASSDNQNDFFTTYFTGGQTSVPVPGTDTGGDPSMPPFFRAHIRPEDWVKTLTAIRDYPCSGPPACPPKGYSMDPKDYELAYAGLIEEATVRHDNLDFPASGRNFDASPTSWISNDPNKAQVMLGLRGYALGIYRGIP